MPKNFVVSKKGSTFAAANKNGGSLAQLNRASDYGSEGCGFESRRSHDSGGGRRELSAFFILILSVKSCPDWVGIVLMKSPLQELPRLGRV